MSGDELEAAERYGLVNYFASVFLWLQYAYVEYQAGVLSEEDLAADEFARTLSGWPSMRASWGRQRESMLRKDFVAFVESFVAPEDGSLVE